MLLNPNVEFLSLGAVWVLANFYSIYRLYNYLESIEHIEYIYGGFDLGWKFLNRSKDDSDFEWSVWRSFTASNWYWLILNFCAAEFFRMKNPKFISFSYFIVAVIFFLYKLGVLGLAIFTCQPIFYWIIILKYPKITIVWLCCIVSFIYIYTLNYLINLHPYNLVLKKYSKEDMYIIMITCSWIQLRCISFSQYYVNLHKMYAQNIPDEISLVRHLSYCFYLPLASLGPIISYEDFNNVLKETNKRSLIQRLYQFLKNITRCAVWYTCVEFCLHFVYFNRLHSESELLKELPSWALYGGGLWMGLFFFMKYLVYYGIGGAFSHLDCIDPPPLPRCIVTVHLYSDMWKYFDVGLYRFLVSVIYKPCIVKLEGTRIPRDIVKTIGSFLCFTFIYVWHGTYTFILVWTVLNYLGVVIENLATRISTMSVISRVKNKLLKDDSAKVRFNALVSSPMLLMSALSNFYFFGGMEFGNYYVNRVCSESISTLVVIFFILYCSCFVSAKIFLQTKRTNVYT